MKPFSLLNVYLTIAFFALLSPGLLYANVSEESNAQDTFYSFESYADDYNAALHGKIEPDSGLPAVISRDYSNIGGHPEGTNSAYMRVEVASGSTFKMVGIDTYETIALATNDYVYFDYWYYYYVDEGWDSDGDINSVKGYEAYLTHAASTAAQSDSYVRWIGRYESGDYKFVAYTTNTWYGGWGNLLGTSKAQWDTAGTWFHVSMVFFTDTSGTTYIKHLRAGSTNGWNHDETDIRNDLPDLTGFTVQYHPSGGDTPWTNGHPSTNGIDDIYMGTSGIYDVSYDLTNADYSPVRSNYLRFRVAYDTTGGADLIITNRLTGFSSNLTSEIQSGEAYYRMGVQLTNQSIPIGTYDIVVSNHADGHVLRRENAFGHELMDFLAFGVDTYSNNIMATGASNFVVTGTNLQTTMRYTLVGTEGEEIPTSIVSNVLTNEHVIRVDLANATSTPSAGVYTLRVDHRLGSNFGTASFDNYTIRVWNALSTNAELSDVRGAGLLAPGGTVTFMNYVNQNTSDAVVLVEIYTLRGRKIGEVRESVASMTESAITWDGSTLNGRVAPQGAYILYITVATDTFYRSYKRAFVLAK